MLPVFSGTAFGELSVWEDARYAGGHRWLLTAPSQAPTLWREGIVTTEHCAPLSRTGQISVPDYGAGFLFEVWHLIYKHLDILLYLALK